MSSNHLLTYTDPNEPPYRNSAGICLINNQGQIFMGEKTRFPGFLQMPQGGVKQVPDNQEKEFEETVYRELFEEIGVTRDKVQMLGAMPDYLFYDFEDYIKAKQAGRAFDYKYRGQRQKWFVLKFLGNDSDINLSGEADPEGAEFKRFEWVFPQEVAAKVETARQEVYRQVIALSEIIRKS